MLLGPDGTDEMCNLYLMYYTLSANDDFKLCFDEEDRALAWKLPEGTVTSTHFLATYFLIYSYLGPLPYQYIFLENVPKWSFL